MAEDKRINSKRGREREKERAYKDREREGGKDVGKMAKEIESVLFLK